VSVDWSKPIETIDGWVAVLLYSEFRNSKGGVSNLVLVQTPYHYDMTYVVEDDGRVGEAVVIRNIG